MKKTAQVITCSIPLVLAMASLATAADPHAKTRGRDVHSAAHHEEANERSMHGTITRLDHESGKIEIKTERGVAQVFFNPASVKTLKEGDAVVMDLETAAEEEQEEKENR